MEIFECPNSAVGQDVVQLLGGLKVLDPVTDSFTATDVATGREFATPDSFTATDTTLIEADLSSSDSFYWTFDSRDLEETQFPFPEVRVEAAFAHNWNEPTVHGWLEVSVNGAMEATPLSWQTDLTTSVTSGELRWSAALRGGDVGGYSDIGAWWFYTADQVIMGHLDSGSDGGWEFYLAAGGELGLRIIDTSSTLHTIESTSFVATASKMMLDGIMNVAVYHDFDTGTTRFYAAAGFDDLTLVDTQTGGPTSCGASDTAIWLGDRPPGSGSNAWRGRIYNWRIWQGTSPFNDAYQETDEFIAALTFDGVEYTPADFANFTAAVGGMTWQKLGGSVNSVVVTRGWTEITDYVQRKITMQRGRQHELRRPEAGKASFTLTSSDDRFNPENTTGPYYPHVKALVPVRVSAQDPKTLTWHQLWRGQIKTWPQEWVHAGKVSRVPIKAVGPLSVFGRVPARTYAATVREDEPVAYWRLWDEHGSARMDDESTGGWWDTRGDADLHVMDVNNSPTFDSTGGPLYAETLHNSGHVRLNGTDEYFDNPDNIADLRLDGDMTVEFWSRFDPDKGPFVGMVINCAVGGGTILYGVQIIVSPGSATSPKLIIPYWYQNNVGTAVSAASVPSDGEWHHYALVRDVTEPDVIQAYVDGVDAGRAKWAGWAPIPTPTTQTVEVGRRVSTSFFDGDLAEVAVYDKALTAGRVKAHYQARIESTPSSLAAATEPYAEVWGWPGFGWVSRYGTDGHHTGIRRGDIDSSVVAEWRRVQESFDALVFVDPAGKLVLEDRYWRAKNQTTPAITLSDEQTPSNAFSYRQLRMPNDDTTIRNVWQVKPEAGLFEEVEDATSAYPYGPRVEKIDQAQLGTTDATTPTPSQPAALDRARWGLSNSKDDKLRIEAVSVTGQSNADMWATIMTADVSTRIGVKRQPPGSARVTREMHIEAVKHEITIGNTWLTTWRLSPAEEANVWVLGDAVMGRLGETTKLGW